MIHAYNEHYLATAQEKLATIFELAVSEEKLLIDDFAQKFINSPVCHAFEIADTVYILGKSANELLGIILSTPPLSIEINSYASPEYWAGYVLAYAQWYFNKPYKEIISAYPCSKLIVNYFPYHEMNITHSLDLFRNKLKLSCALKDLRTERRLSQTQLSVLSGVPVRNIKAYEQGSVDIAKAQAETLYALAQTLNCTIEDLIK